MRIWRLFAGALLLGLMLGSGPARAVQGTGCLPLSGQYTGVAYASRINAAFAALISSNAGTAAPATDCSAAPVTGQAWFDTSITGLPRFALFDGSQWLGLGFFDSINHIWEPQIGGGVGNLASAATVDLCSRPEGYIAVSGTVTISQFGGTKCAIGQIKVVTFSDSTILSHSTSAIVLPTRAAITTQAGDTAVMAYTGGGIWNAVSYTRASGFALVSPTPPPIPPVHYAGQFITMRTTTCPDGSIPEDGSAVSRTGNPQLFAALGTTWGAGDGSTTFNVPNSGGQFDRGWVPGQTVDSGRTFGAAQLDALQNHTHQYFQSANQNGNLYTNGSQNNPNIGGTQQQSGTGSNARFASETRPVNITALHCIFTSNSP